MRHALISIDINAVRSNFRFLKQQADGAKVMAVVKANAYGHGAVDIARALDEADAFAVAFVEEAAELRKAGIQAPILVLQGAATGRTLKLAESLSLWLVVQSESQAAEVVDSRADVPLWLKANTGMGRLGLAPERLEFWRQRLGQRCDCLMTHFASADNQSSPRNTEQLELFAEISASSGLQVSLANSAALLSMPQARGDWVRPGIALYGGNPFASLDEKPSELQPVMQIKAPLVSKQWRKKGQSIGYSGLSICEEDMPVGVISMGYADGYPRLAKPGTPVAVDGVICPTLGRVSMDMICVDLRNCPDVQEGAEVEMWGHTVSVDEVAASAGTISYELMCQAGAALLSRGQRF